MLGASTEDARTDGQLATDDVLGELVAAVPVTAWSRMRPAGLDHAVGPFRLSVVDTVLRQARPRDPRLPRSGAPQGSGRSLSGLPQEGLIGHDVRCCWRRDLHGGAVVREILHGLAGPAGCSAHLELECHLTR
jgi:hypothetical protein